MAKATSTTSITPDTKNSRYEVGPPCMACPLNMSAMLLASEPKYARVRVQGMMDTADDTAKELERIPVDKGQVAASQK